MAEIGSRPRRLLVGKTTTGLGDLSTGTGVADVVERIGAFEVQELAADGAGGPSGRVVEQLAVAGEAPHTVIAELNETALEQLRRQFGETLIVEEDEPLDMQDAPPSGIDYYALSNALPLSDMLSVEVEILGEDGTPVERASVTVQGGSWIDRGVTDARGRATIELFGETPASVRRILVKPADGYWGRDIRNPVITDGVNRVTLEALPVGNGQPQDSGWGGEAMNLVADGDPAATVRVAVIDSGLATTHGDLGPEGGFDFGDGDSPETSWGTDGSGHGTHVSGTVAALNNGFGVRGMAPGVELFGFRVFPGATMSKLIGAVDRCIDHRIDVANMSLGGSSKSVLLQQRLRAARDAGVLPVAAAGNSSGPVLFPAAFPEALCVAAIGRLGTFPDSSPHAGHVTDRLSADGRYFAAKFTCRGPEVNVCAPGVAIISSVPPNGYAAFDGTSMASPHVAGFAARLLQTTPAIREMPRGAARSQALFDAVIARCEPLGLPAEFQGAGLPRLPAEPDHDGSEDGDGGVAGAQPSLEQIRELIEQALAKARALP